MPYMILIALLIVFWAVGAYQRLLRQRKQCRIAFARIEAQAKRRHELIPDLIAIVQEYVQDEHAALDAVIAADKEAVAACADADRNALDMDAMARLIEAEAMLESALSTMFALTQRHLEQLSSSDMDRVIEELSAAESGMVFARQVYNEAANHYNAARAQFPGSVIAIVFAFTPVALLPSTDMPQASHP